MGSSDEWNIPCLGANEELEPTPDELDAMYQKLSAGETLELTWKCIGRRSPTPIQVADTEVKNNSNAAQSSKNLEFDFMDEVAAPTMSRVQRPGVGPKSSVKKKVANFSGVLDTIKKNKRTPNQPK